MDITGDNKSKYISRGWDSFDRSLTFTGDCNVDEDALRTMGYVVSNDGWTVNCVNNIAEQVDSLTKQVNNTVVSLDGLKEIIDRIPPEVKTYNSGVQFDIIGGWSITGKDIHKINRRVFKTSFKKISLATS